MGRTSPLLLPWGNTRADHSHSWFTLSGACLALAVAAVVVCSAFNTSRHAVELLQAEQTEHAWHGVDTEAINLVFKAQNTLSQLAVVQPPKHASLWRMSPARARRVDEAPEGRMEWKAIDKSVALMASERGYLKFQALAEAKQDDQDSDSEDDQDSDSEDTADGNDGNDRSSDATDTDEGNAGSSDATDADNDNAVTPDDNDNDAQNTNEDNDESSDVEESSSSDSNEDGNGLNLFSSLAPKGGGGKVHTQKHNDTTTHTRTRTRANILN